ncbi:MAG TPA: UDP-N-acetylglucosamine 1-carboxyvinyltransferase [Clostridiales bacterium]|nr:UDP-N-acetylglucosamine 1-carboxyvinyltransferase [Clostridiales bacterium]
MEKFVIHGGKQLHGEVNISGAKNAALAIIPAAVLCEDTCRIENIPNISDVKTMISILEYIGARTRFIKRDVLEIDTKNIKAMVTVPDDMTQKLRASYYLLGAMLGRFGCASVAMPGGCFFGVRPIDQHVRGFELLGADITTKGAVISASAAHLIGASVYMDNVSVGATMNVMLAAVKASGLTVIENAAKEPHVVDLANFLNSMGADVRGAGTDVIKIRGVRSLHGCTYSIIPDQIEAGTYMVAAGAAGGSITIKNVIPKHLESISVKLIESGIEVMEYDDSITIISDGKRPNKCIVKTMPHPGFPTDMQPQMAVLLSVANGTSYISESVWDNRFMYVEQLRRMGAKIQVDGKTATIEGMEYLVGAPVKADDLRAGAAMVIAGLIAKGETVVDNVHYIERGYENIIEKLIAVGADIERVTVLTDEDRIVAGAV